MEPLGGVFSWCHCGSLSVLYVAAAVARSLEAGLSACRAGLQQLHHQSVLHAAEFGPVVRLQLRVNAAA